MDCVNPGNTEVSPARVNKSLGNAGHKCGGFWVCGLMEVKVKSRWGCDIAMAGMSPVPSLGMLPHLVPFGATQKQRPAKIKRIKSASCEK